MKKFFALMLVAGLVGCGGEAPKKEEKKAPAPAPKVEKKAEAPKEEKKTEAPKTEKKAEAPKEVSKEVKK